MPAADALPLQLPELSAVRIAVVGLGYVGLPLAVELGRRFETLGFDIDSARIRKLLDGRDETREVDAVEIASASRLTFTHDPRELADCNVFIVTVPTPIDADKRPDLALLIAASQTVGTLLNRGDTVVFESTVYPGCTEDICVPILESASGFVLNKDFVVGYSPERINPGDRAHRLANTVKVTSGSTPAAADFIDRLYGSILEAGTYKAGSIRVAEAAKVIENTQRDLNIALVNDLAMLFNRLGIDTLDVLEAAGTKWNFMPFRPGLVGGHCISVDPYYLTHVAQMAGHHPHLILAGRRTNDGMGAYIAEQVLALVAQRGIDPREARALVLGLAFKEDCTDARNTRVLDLVRAMEECGIKVDIHDPWVDPGVALHEIGIALTADPQAGAYDAVVLAVAHAEFRALGAHGVRAFGKPGCVVYDVKSVLPKDAVDGRL